MNMCDIGPGVKSIWGDQWGEKVSAPDYPMHVVLEGKPQEFQAEPFTPFTKLSTSFVILPLTPKIAEALHQRTLVSATVVRDARVLAERIRHNDIP